jgi:cephalosporin hydroxylase
MELSTGKYSAHPDVNLDDYITNIPITTPLTLKDRNRVSADYLSRMNLPEYINGLAYPVKSLPINYSEETVLKVIECLKDVQCTQNYYEVSSLCERVKELEPKTILEIGVDRGGSMNLWLSFSPPDALYIGVDNAMQFVIKRDHKQTKKFIEADSQKPSTLDKVKEILDGRQVDFLFIDGNHEGDIVRSDYAMYSPLVRSGGIIALHDIDVTINESACEGIKELWKELKEVNENTNEFINTEVEFRFGIGMIIK